MFKNWKLLVVVGFAALGVMLMGAGSATVTSDQAKDLVSKQHALLLDVRTPQEFASGHIEGAVNVPVQVLESQLTTLPAKKDQAIVVYCRSGHRSANAKAILEKGGFTKVHDLGAMTNWKP